MFKLKISFVIFISIAFVNCNSSVGEYDKYSAKQISVMSYSKSLKLGISYYKNKKNKIALPFLETAVKHKKGKAYYYLGNVLMNLQKYKQAISSYSKAYFKGYREADSIFNAACAYSLLNKPRLTLMALLDSNKSLSRIKKDPDLSNFRLSKCYKQYLKDRKFNSKGIIPNSKINFMKNMLFGNYFGDTSVLYGTNGYKFTKDGLFFSQITQGGRRSVGSWIIDGKNKILVIKVESNFRVYSDPPHPKLDTIKTISDFKKIKFTNMKTYKIPFENIRLRIKKIFTYFFGEQHYKYEKVIIGNKQRDGISLVLGRYLSPNWLNEKMIGSL